MHALTGGGGKRGLCRRLDTRRGLEPRRGRQRGPFFIVRMRCLGIGQSSRRRRYARDGATGQMRATAVLLGSPQAGQLVLHRADLGLQSNDFFRAAQHDMQCRRDCEHGKTSGHGHLPAKAQLCTGDKARAQCNKHGPRQHNRIKPAWTTVARRPSGWGRAGHRPRLEQARERLLLVARIWTPIRLRMLRGI